MILSRNDDGFWITIKLKSLIVLVGLLLHKTFEVEDVTKYFTLHAPWVDLCAIRDIIDMKVP